MFYGWKLLAALSFIYFLAIGTTFYGFGVVLPPMLKDLAWSRAQAATGFSILTMALGFAGPLVAILIRKISTRMTVFIGGLLSASGALLVYTMPTEASFTLDLGFTVIDDRLLLFYVGAGLLLGLGMAMQTVIPGTQLVSSWFVKRRAFAIGLFMASGGLGAFVAAPAYSMLIESTNSWRIVWVVMAAAAVFAGLIGFAMIKENPAEIGDYPDGIDPNVEDSRDDDATPVVPSNVHKTTDNWDVSEALKTASFWSIVAGATIAVFGTMIVNSQLVLHLTDIGVTATMAASALGLQGLLNTGGRLISGFVGDRIDPKKLLIVGLTVETLGILILSHATTPVLVYSFAVAFGLGYGLCVVAYASLIANYFGSTNYASLMATRGVVVTAVGAVAPIAAGMVSDTYNSYVPAFYGFACIAVVGVIGIVIFMKPPVLVVDATPEMLS